LGAKDVAIDPGLSYETLSPLGDESVATGQGPRFEALSPLGLKV